MDENGQKKCSNGARRNLKECKRDGWIKLLKCVGQYVWDLKSILKRLLSSSRWRMIVNDYDKYMYRYMISSIFFWFSFLKTLSWFSVMLHM